ncbi:MAG: hypothetical protein OJF51_001365 [Nitrospira sp.]|nr:MAG: hypothetical protein OJF51_001365 [Nitrospira sp.]
MNLNQFTKNTKEYDKRRYVFILSGECGSAQANILRMK